MKNDTLKHAMLKQLGEKIDYDKTFKQYRRDIERFSAWAKQTHKIRLANQVADKVQLINDYSSFLQTKGYSVYTIHRYLAPICKGLRVNMKDVKKPKRELSKVVKTREKTRNKRGWQDLERLQDSRIIRAQRAIGIRKEELYKLRGRDLIEEDGRMYVLVERGKGGKRQRQRVAEIDQDTVRDVFRGVSADGRVFSPKEAKSVSRVPLHYLRAEHARELYTFYADQAADPKRRVQLQNELIETFREAHPEGGNPRKVKEFRDLMIKGNGIYRLRGANREKFEQVGRPTEYDRVALMCVSVWHLSHWRLDVTVDHYMR